MKPDPLVANRNVRTISGGNHSAELQRVHPVYDEIELAQYNLNKQSVVLLVHSGFRGLGQQILRSHVDQHGVKGLSTSVDDDKRRLALAYLKKHNCAATMVRG